MIRLTLVAVAFLSALKIVEHFDRSLALGIAIGGGLMALLMLFAGEKEGTSTRPDPARPGGRDAN